MHNKYKYDITNKLVDRIFNLCDYYSEHYNFVTRLRKPPPPPPPPPPPLILTSIIHSFCLIFLRIAFHQLQLVRRLEGSGLEFSKRYK